MSHFGMMCSFGGKTILYYCERAPPTALFLSKMQKRNVEKRLIIHAQFSRVRAPQVIEFSVAYSNLGEINCSILNWSCSFFTIRDSYSQNGFFESKEITIMAVYSRNMATLTKF